MNKQVKELIVMIKKQREELLNNGIRYNSGLSDTPNDPTQLIMLYDTLLHKLTEDKEAA